MGKLSEFLAPVEPAQVLNKERRRELGLHSGKSASSASDLFSWPDLIGMACAIEDPTQIRVTSNRHTIPVKFLSIENRIAPQLLEKLIGRGASIVIPDGQRYDDRLGEIVSELIEVSAMPAWLGVIGSSGSSGALTQHADGYDLFIRQIEGTKKWRFLSSADGDADLLEEHVLREGDYLFVPAGQVHECDTIGDRSLHLGLGFAGSDYQVWA